MTRPTIVRGKVTLTVTPLQMELLLAGLNEGMQTFRFSDVQRARVRPLIAQLHALLAGVDA